jgi:ketosteroid isomerase-like protein
MTAKENFIQEFNQAFANGDIPFILDCLTESIEWVMIGGNTHRGKAAFEMEMSKMKDFEMMEMKIDKVITHGKFASANGRFKINEKEQEKTYGFCDVYEFDSFKGLKIKNIT